MNLANPAVDIFATDRPDSVELAAIAAGLDDHRTETADTSGGGSLAVLARTADGALAGGAECSLRGDVLMVRKLWVAKALRGSGLGAALMGRCETEAVHRGCARVCVDTMSFQAPAFYRRLGYREKGVIRDVYGGHDRIFFEKHLRGAA